MAAKTAASVRTIAEVVNLVGEPKLANLQQTAGERSTFGVVKALLMRMASRMHMDNGLTEQDISYLATYLTTDDEVRWWLTLADIDLLCRQIADGRYGKFYNHFSEQEFRQCMVKYCNERTEEHRIKNERTTTDTQPLAKVGYTVDEKGNLIVPKAVQEKDPFQPPLYIFDDHGRRICDNPKAWNKIKTERQRKDEQNERVVNYARTLMHENPDETWITAIEKAEKALKGGQQ